MGKSLGEGGRRKDHIGSTSKTQSIWVVTLSTQEETATILAHPVPSDRRARDWKPGERRVSCPSVRAKRAAARGLTYIAQVKMLSKCKIFLSAKSKEQLTLSFLPPVHTGGPCGSRETTRSSGSLFYEVNVGMESGVSFFSRSLKPCPFTVIVIRYSGTSLSMSHRH